MCAKRCVNANFRIFPAVQHERGPRNSTLRRQMALYFKEPEMMANMVPPPAAALDLALPKPPTEPRVSVAAPAPHHPFPHPVYCNSMAMSKVRSNPLYHISSLRTINNIKIYFHYFSELLFYPFLVSFSFQLKSPESQPNPSNPTKHPIKPRNRYIPIYINPKPNSVLPNLQIPVNMTGLPSMPLIPAITAESICEQAARLLFLNVHWARDLATGTNLAIEDQLTLLESSWRELFLLAAAQILPTLDPTALLPPGPQGLSLAVEVNRFRGTLAGFHAMNLDQHEFACIRAIVLFKAGLDSEPLPSSRSSNGSTSPNVGSRLRDAAAVARLRDGAQLALGQRLSGASFGALRFGKLLLLLPTLRSVSTHAIEELFFRRTIGVIPIERIICDMYKAAWRGSGWKRGDRPEEFGDLEEFGCLKIWVALWEDAWWRMCLIETVVRSVWMIEIGVIDLLKVRCWVKGRLQIL